MITVLRVEAFKAFKKAHEEASVKIRETISEAYNLVVRLYQAEAENETKVNIVDSLYIDLYYEQILIMKITLLLHFPIKSVGAYPLIGDMMRR
jgi:hypothetical protein